MVKKWYFHCWRCAISHPGKSHWVMFWCALWSEYTENEMQRCPETTHSAFVLAGVMLISNSALGDEQMNALALWNNYYANQWQENMAFCESPSCRIDYIDGVLGWAGAIRAKYRHALPNMIKATSHCARWWFTKEMRMTLRRRQLTQYPVLLHYHPLHDLSSPESASERYVINQNVIFPNQSLGLCGRLQYYEQLRRIFFIVFSDWRASTNWCDKAFSIIWAHH